jgi:hypothetical protein
MRRIGQNIKITRRWAGRGSRPSPADLQHKGDEPHIAEIATEVVFGAENAGP